MHRSSYLLILSVAVLFFVGLLMVFNTTSAEVLGDFQHQKSHYPVIKQMIHAVIGILLGGWLYRVDYHQFFKYAPLLFWITTLTLILVFIPKIGQQINGAHRWIGIGGVFAFQPSEFMRALLPIYYLALFTVLNKPLVLKSFLRILFTLAIPILLILFEPDNGSVGIMLVTLVALFYLTKVRWIYWGMPLMVIAGVSALFASKMSHVTDRIHVYLNPELDILGKGHQPYQAKVAAGSGGLFGRGLGESLQKLSYLPEARSDYIAAIYAEEFGFIGVSLLILFYMLIGYFGFKIANKAVDKQGFYLASILTFIICFQAFLNLGVVSGLLPSKGTNLPFFSHGGSSLIANIIMLSCILNIGKHTYRQIDGKAYVSKKIKIRSGVSSSF